MYLSCFHIKNIAPFSQLYMNNNQTPFKNNVKILELIKKIYISKLVQPHTNFKSKIKVKIKCNYVVPYQINHGNLTSISSCEHIKD